LQKHEQWYRMIENIGNNEYIDEGENPYSRSQRAGDG
jgi:hypothetical protein